MTKDPSPEEPTEIDRQKLSKNEFIQQAIRSISDDPNDPMASEVQQLFHYVNDLAPHDQSLSEEDFTSLTLIKAPTFVEFVEDDKRKSLRLFGVVKFMLFALEPRMKAQKDEYLRSKYQGFQKEVGEAGESIPMERMNEIFDSLMEISMVLGLVHPDDVCT